MLKNKMRRAAAALLAVAMSLACVLTANAAGADKFNDVPKSAWYYEAVSFAVDNGLFNGTSATQFSPNAGMTRGMFVTVLGRYAKVDTAQYQGTQFNDVAESAYYAPYAKWASKNGVAQGTGNDKFSPDATITRQQLATMMCNYAASTGKEVAVSTADAVVYYAFPDQNTVASYAVEPLKWATYNRVINGSDGKLKPAATATRAEVAQLMTNFDKYIKGETTPNTTPDVKPDPKPSGAITVWNPTMYEMAEELIETNYDAAKVKAVGEKYAPIVCGKENATIEELIAAMKAMTGAPYEAASMGTERANIYWANVLATAIGKGEEPKPDDKPAVTDAQLRAYEDEMVRLVNEERKKEGLPALNINEKLVDMARVRVDELTVKFSHERPSGDVYDLLNSVGLPVKNYHAENIISGTTYSTPQSFMDTFMESDGHKSWILSSEVNAIGIAFTLNENGQFYAVQVFGEF